MPYRSFFADGPAHAAALLDAVRRESGEHVLKVILESGELAGLESVRALTSFAVDRGADFVKTSTGKTPISATPGAVRAMLGVLRSHALTTGGDGRVGIKPSGGIRTFDDAAGYLRIADDVMGPGWATPSTFRFGASALLDALLEAMGAGQVGPA